MMKKMLFAGLMIFAFAAAVNAAPVVRIDFPCQNFWGQMICLDKLPSGVWIGERQEFWDKRKKGYTFPVFVDLAKADSFDVTFKFTGQGMARLCPEITGYAGDDRTGKIDLRVLEFSIDGDNSSRVPATFNSWYGVTPFISANDKELRPGSPVKAGQMYYQVFVTNGKTIRVKAKFATVE